MTAPRGLPSHRHAIRWLVETGSGRVGWLLILAILAAYVWLGLTPFEWQPPRRVQNGAKLTSDGMAVATEGIAKVGGMGEWLNSARAGKRLRLQITVMAYAGTGTLLAYNDLSGDSGNLVLWQNGSELHLYVGLPQHGMHAGRWYAIAYAFRDPGWHEVEVVIDDRQLIFGVKGVETQRDTWSACPLTYWRTNRAEELTLANVIGGTDPWLGEIQHCKIEAGADEFDLLSPAQCHTPATYLANVKIDSHLDLRPTRDNLLNFLGFVPLGGLLTFGFQPRRAAAAWAILACLLISIGMECTQAFFGHVSSVTDVVTNGMGGGVGAITALVLIAVAEYSWEHERPWASMPPPNT